METNNTQYIPSIGDIVYSDLDPIMGHEQGGRRPVVVLSNMKYSSITGMCIVSPVTSSIKGYAFESILKTCQTQGAVLSDHIRTIDWRCRNISYVERLSDDQIQEINRKRDLLFR